MPVGLFTEKNAESGPQDSELCSVKTREAARKENEKCSPLSSYEINMDAPSVVESEEHQSSSFALKKRFKTNVFAVTNSSRWRHDMRVSNVLNYKLSSGLHRLLKVCIVNGTNP